MTSTDVVRVRYARTPYLVVTTEQHQRKDVYGSIDDAVVRQAQLLPGTTVASIYGPSSPVLSRFGLLVSFCNRSAACMTRR